MQLPARPPAEAAGQEWLCRCYALQVRTGPALQGPLQLADSHRLERVRHAARQCTADGLTVHKSCQNLGPPAAPAPPTLAWNSASIAASSGKLSRGGRGSGPCRCSSPLTQRSGKLCRTSEAQLLRLPNPAGTAQQSAGGRSAAQWAVGAGSGGTSLVDPQRSSAVLQAQQQWLPAIRGMAVKLQS